MEQGSKSRRQRRRSFGTVVSVGTSTEPAFVVRYWEGRKRRQRSGFRTRKDAQIALAEAQTEIESGTAEAKRRADVTLGEVGAKWLDLHSANLRSHGTNEKRWRKHVMPRLGHLALSAVTAERLLEFRGALVATGNLKPATVNRVLALLRSILRFAAAHDYLPASPTDKLPRGAYMLAMERKRREPPIPSFDDIGRLLAKLAQLFPDLHALYAAAFYLGLRKGELCGLRWDDIDFEKGFVTVKRSFAAMTKSGRWRTVPIPGALRPILLAHRLRDPHKGAVVFPAPDGAMFTTDARLHDRLGVACKAIGINPIRLHDCRHQYASTYLALGGSLADLQRNMGHSSISTTELYLHAADERRIQEAQRLRFEAPPEATVTDIRAGK